MTFPDLLKRMRESEKLATGGPWSFYEDTCRICKENNERGFNLSGVDGNHHAQFGNENDATFIALSRQYIPASFAEIDRLRVALVKAENALLEMTMNGNYASRGYFVDKANATIKEIRAITGEKT